MCTACHPAPEAAHWIAREDVGVTNRDWIWQCKQICFRFECYQPVHFTKITRNINKALHAPFPNITKVLKKKRKHITFTITKLSTFHLFSRFSALIFTLCIFLNAHLKYPRPLRKYLKKFPHYSKNVLIYLFNNDCIFK